jgi:hypothetical protein
VVFEKHDKDDTGKMKMVTTLEVYNLQLWISNIISSPCVNTIVIIVKIKITLLEARRKRGGGGMLF